MPVRPRSIPPLTDADLRRFLDKISFTDPSGCWIWTASTNGRGYGSFKLQGRAVLPHRVAYQTWIGPLDPDLVLDHAQCDTRVCVNPTHMRQTTNWANVMRGNGGAARNARGELVGGAAERAAKTHCPAGHPYAGDNLYRRPNGSRECRACRRHHDRARRPRAVQC